MGTWGTAIKDSDAFQDVYSEFFDYYNKGIQTELISKKIIEGNSEILEIDEEKNSLWFALVLAQWETKSLEPHVFTKVRDIISSESDIKIWESLGASTKDIQKRKIALNKFLQKIGTERTKAKPRKKVKIKTPIFETGECLVFTKSDGNYGGAVILATDNAPDTGYNLVATTRINQSGEPNLKDFKNAEVLVCNFGQWEDRPDIAWRMPDLFYKDHSDTYKSIGKLEVDIIYKVDNREGKDYLFKPSYTSGWDLMYSIESQLESELSKEKPPIKITVKQLTKKKKWWSLT